MDKEEFMDIGKFYLYQRTHYQRSDDAIWDLWLESINSNEPDEPETVGKHEQNKVVCQCNCIREVHKINERYICAKCNKPVAN